MLRTLGLYNFVAAYQYQGSTAGGNQRESLGEKQTGTQYKPVTIIFVTHEYKKWLAEPAIGLPMHDPAMEKIFCVTCDLYVGAESDDIIIARPKRCRRVCRTMHVVIRMLCFLTFPILYPGRTTSPSWMSIDDWGTGQPEIIKYVEISIGKSHHAYFIVLSVRHDY